MQTTLKIDGMSCQHCVMAVKKELQKLDLQNFDVKIGEAVVDFDETKLKAEDIIAAIEEAGYKAINQ
jgi:copper chaperone